MAGLASSMIKPNLDSALHRGQAFVQSNFGFLSSSALHYHFNISSEYGATVCSLHVQPSSRLQCGKSCSCCWPPTSKRCTTCAFPSRSESCTMNELRDITHAMHNRFPWGTSTSHHGKTSTHPTCTSP